MRSLGIILMLSGLGLIGWFGFQYWNSMESVQQIEGANVVKDNTDDYTNPFSADDKQINSELPTKNTAFQLGDQMATLVIPSIDLVFDVFLGTDDDVLAKGVGMYQSDLTTTPDVGGHTVLSGHRDSVFSPVGELEHGESLYVRYQGIDYHYEIEKTWITDAEDRSVIVEKDEPTLTLSTCYPFRFVGSAPDRYIVEAKLVDQGDLLDLDF
ncbi:class D sortase [Virgibacillus sp. MSJ-26]|nr:class D sortase [Virgibacillus sp. MSJ-26]